MPVLLASRFDGDDRGIISTQHRLGDAVSKVRIREVVAVILICGSKEILNAQRTVIAETDEFAQIPILYPRIAKGEIVHEFLGLRIVVTHLCHAGVGENGSVHVGENRNVVVEEFLYCVIHLIELRVAREAIAVVVALAAAIGIAAIDIRYGTL